MGEKVNAEKAKTELAQVNDLVREILKVEAKERKLRDEKKALLVQAQEIVERNRARWFGDKKSFRVDAGTLKFEAVSKVVVGKKFSLDEFLGNFPSLFRFKAEHNIPAGELRAFLKDADHSKKLEMLDVGIDTVERFKVEE
jgi:hypothetical protein